MFVYQEHYTSNEQPEEEVDFEDDPVVNDDGDDDVAMGSPPDCVSQAQVAATPQQEAAMECDQEHEEESATARSSQVAETAAEVPPTAHSPLDNSRTFVGRRTEAHAKSFEWSVFYIRYREDESPLYPNRVNSWWTTCPYHQSCGKSVQVNMPSEEVALRRLLHWCLDAPKYRSKQEPSFLQR